MVRQLRSGKGVVESPLKSDSSERAFVLTPELWNELLRRAPQAGGHVCLNSAGNPWNPERLTQAWRLAAPELGLEGWHFHDLRHVAASALAAIGVDLLTIAAVLGHAKIDTSMLYAAAQEATAMRGIRALGNALFPVDACAPDMRL